jgi:hypothetical protein
MPPVSNASARLSSSCRSVQQEELQTRHNIMVENDVECVLFIVVCMNIYFAITADRTGCQNLNS